MTGPLADVDLAILLAFLVGSVVVVWSTVVIAAFLPQRLGPMAGLGPKGAVVILAAVAGIAALLISLVLTVPLLPSAVAVIAAGAAVLGGPFLVEPLPTSLRESRLAPVAIVILSLLALAQLPRPF